jgi:hypothetical protein
VTYFPDPSPYAYGHGSHPGVVHVGWLGRGHSYATGTVDIRLIEKMRRLASRPVELYRGKHHCELCIEPPNLIKAYLPNRVVLDPRCSWAQWYEQTSSNGEIRVSREVTCFAAPVLIVHYIEAHHYLPPDDFLRAIEDAPEP